MYIANRRPERAHEPLLEFRTLRACAAESSHRPPRGRIPDETLCSCGDGDGKLLPGFVQGGSMCSQAVCDRFIVSATTCFGVVEHGEQDVRERSIGLV